MGYPSDFGDPDDPGKALPDNSWTSWSVMPTPKRCALWGFGCDGWIQVTWIDCEHNMSVYIYIYNIISYLRQIQGVCIG